MESILGEILMGIAKIHEGADPEKAAEECADKIIKEMSGAGNCAADGQAASGEEHPSFPSGVKKAGAFRVSIEHIAGAPAVSVSVVGKGRDVSNGIINLLEKTALIMTDGKASEAARLVEIICKIVKTNILLEENE